MRLFELERQRDKLCQRVKSLEDSALTPTNSKKRRATSDQSGDDPSIKRRKADAEQSFGMTDQVHDDSFDGDLDLMSAMGDSML